VNATQLPTSVTAPDGCTAGSGGQSTVDGQQAVTFELNCGSNPGIVEQYRQVNWTTQLRIQVRASDQKTRTSVLDSAAYKP